MPILKRMTYLWVAMLLGCAASYGQSVDSVTGKVLNFPSKLLGRIQSRTVSLDRQLTRQTEKYLQRIAKREERLKKKLYKIDSTAARNLFANSSQQYAALAQKMKTDTGDKASALKGAYLPYADSLRCGLSFLQQNPQLLGSTGVVPANAVGSGLHGPVSGLNGAISSLPVKELSPTLEAKFRSSMSELQALQARMQNADQVRQYVRDRKEQIKQYLSQYTNLPGGISKEYQGLSQDLYYYTQQVQVYKDMLNDPDKLETKALSMINKLPGFPQFMQHNSQLASLFGTPANYGSAQSVAGLPTRDQMQQIIQGQVSAGGSGGMGALEQNLQSAQSQLDHYKDKLIKLGTGGGDVDRPDFKPNEEKVRNFWKRLEFGTNFQTTKTNYFPTTTDFGMSLGYKLGRSNIAGIGAAYKLGWGRDINHIDLSSQGVGFRSFLDIRLKGSFSATGGLEYNYATPFTSLQQIRKLNYWTQSGLIGVSKTISVKSRVFKKTKLILLWDFLSYQQMPKTQSLLFRVGYVL